MVYLSHIAAALLLFQFYIGAAGSDLEQADATDKACMLQTVAMQQPLSSSKLDHFDKDYIRDGEDPLKVAAKKKAEEEAAKRREAEAKRKMEEQEALKKAEEETAKKRAEEVAEQKKKEAEAAKKKNEEETETQTEKEEAANRRAKEDADRKREEEKMKQRKAEQESQKRKELEAAAREEDAKRMEEAEKAKKGAAAEVEKNRKEALAAKKIAEEAAQKVANKTAAEKRRKEEEAANQTAAAKLEQKRKENEAASKAAADELKKKRAAEEAANKTAAAEAQKKEANKKGETIQHEIELPVNTSSTRKDKLVLTLINVLMVPAYCGVDRCYMGETTTGLIKALTFSGLGFWGIIDFLVILVNSLQSGASIHSFGFNADFDNVEPAFYAACIHLILIVLCCICSLAAAMLGVFGDLPGLHDKTFEVK